MFHSKLVKMFKYQILPGTNAVYLEIQEQAQALYREHAEIEFTYLQDSKNPLLKTELINFYDADAIQRMEKIDSDPRVLALFKKFETSVLDKAFPIQEEMLEDIGLSNSSKIHHIEIYCSSLKKSADFWGWFLGELGYKEFQKWPEGVSFKLGASYLVLVQADAKHLDAPFNRCRPGLNHLAFHAPSRQFIDQITLKLQEKGVRILYTDKHPHAGGPETYGVFFEDPERLKVELMAPPI